MNSFLDTFFIFGAEYAYLILVGIAILYWIKRPNKKQIFIFGVIALPVIYVTARLLSLLYYNPRPFVEDNFAPLIPHAPDNGFPSDHTLLSAAIASVLYPFNKKLGLLAWLLTLFVGISRVMVGVHHTIDVAGSMVIAIVITSLISQYIKKEPNRSPIGPA